MLPAARAAWVGIVFAPIGGLEHAATRGIRLDCHLIGMSGRVYRLDPTAPPLLDSRPNRADRARYSADLIAVSGIRSPVPP